MRNSKFIRNIIFCLFLVSCGFTDDKPVSGSKIFTPKNLSNCKLNTDAFEKILKEDIKAQLTCLEEKFLSFSKYVLSYNKDIIGQKELSTFVRQVFKSNTDGIIQGLGLLFKVNSLLLRDNFGELSKKNISPLIKMLISTNKYSIIITKNLDIILNTKNKYQYQMAKNEVESSLKSFTYGVSTIIEQKHGKNNKVNIEKLLKEIYQKTGSESQNSLLFVKKLFLGGDKDIITTEEVVIMLKKLPSLIMVAIEMSSSREEFYEEDQDYYNTLEKQLGKLTKLFYHHKRRDLIYSIDDLIKLTKKFEKKSLFQKINYKKIIKSFKKEILASDGDYFTSHDLLTKINLIQIWLSNISIMTRFKDIYNTQIKEIETKKLTLMHDKIINASKTLKKKIINFNKKRNLIPKKMLYFNFTRVLNEEMNVYNGPLKTKAKISDQAMNGIFSIKTLFSGGAKEAMTRNEFFHTIETIPNLIEIASEFIIKSKTLNKSQLYMHYFQVTKKFEKLFFPMPKSRKIISIDELIAVLSLIHKDINFKNFKRTILILKQKVMKSESIENNNFFKMSHFLYLTKSLKNTFLKTHFNVTGYLYFKELTTKNRKLEIEDFNKNHFLKTKQLKIFNKQKKEILYKEFIKLITTKRYYLDKENSQAFFGKTIKRNLHNFIQTTIIKEVLTIALKSFGGIKNKKNNPSMNHQQLSILLDDFKPLLQEFDLWTTEPENFANNTILLADLFGTHSDGDQEINLAEGIEYSGLIIQTYILGGKIMKALEKHCEIIRENDKTYFDLSCYRRNFFPALFDNGLNFQVYLPRLHQFSKNPQNSKILEAFLENIETFARDKDRLCKPMGRRDFTLVIGAILNIESTFMRFDTDFNNTIGNFELTKSYLTYKNSIAKISNLWGWASGLSKPIFFYMIHKMVIPSMTDLSYYLSFGNYRKHISGKKILNAKRHHIGTLLRYLVELSTDSNSEEEKSPELCSN